MILGISACIALGFTSCKSSESAYKKAYEKAKQQELATTHETTEIETTPVISTVDVVKAPSSTNEAGVRKERVTVVGGEELKDYSVVCGSFGVKANAEGLKDYLKNQGYNPIIAFNADAAMYRVIVATYTDKNSAVSARNAFKERYPNRKDFQESWLLYRL